MADTTIYFATNRRPNDPKNPTEFTSDFVGDLTDIRFGWTTTPGSNLFRINDSDGLDKLGAKTRIDVAPEDLAPPAGKAPLLGSKTVFERIQKEMMQGRDLLFLIHGYDYTFRQAAARAAQLKQWYGGDSLVLFLFTWPSLGAGVGRKTYDDDRQRAKASGQAIGRTFLKAVDFMRGLRRDQQCKQRLHLMAHSMGNWALRGAIEHMRTFVGDNIPPVVDEVLLMAADDDDDTLSRSYKLQPMLRGCRRVTVYYHVQDIALKASDWVMGNPDRLGLSGPEARAELPPKVATINVGPAIYWDAPAGKKWQEDDTGHQYYRNNDVIQKDVLQVLKGKATADIEGRTKGDHEWRLDRRRPTGRSRPRR